MARRLAYGLLALAACNAKLEQADDTNNSPDARTATDSSTTTTPDAPVMLGPWSTPQLVPGAATTVSEDDLTLNTAQTELYFAIPDAVNGNKDLWIMRRASKTDAWGPKQLLTEFNTTTTEESPRLSPDDLTIYFGRNGQIMTATRTAVGAPWMNLAVVGGVSTTAYEKWLAVCNGNYFMVSRDNGPTGQDLFAGTLMGGAGSLVATLSLPTGEISTFLSKDCLDVYYSSNGEMYTAHRGTMNDPWPSPTLVTEFNTATFGEEDGWMSDDKRAFYFVSNASGSKDLYFATR